MTALEAEGAGVQSSPSASRTPLSPLNNGSNRPAGVTTPCSAAGHVAEGQCDILTPIGQQPPAASPRISVGHASQARRLQGPDAVPSSAYCKTPGDGVLPCETGGEHTNTNALGKAAVRPGAASGSPNGGGLAVSSSQHLDGQSRHTMASPAHVPHHRVPLVAVPGILPYEEANMIAGDPAVPHTGNGAQLQQDKVESKPQDGQAEQPFGQPIATNSGALVSELPPVAVASRSGSRSPQHGERSVSQAKAAEPAAGEAQSAGPKGELLGRVTAALCSGHQAAPPLPDWLVERLTAFPDCLLDAVKSGEPIPVGLPCTSYEQRRSTSSCANTVRA